MVQLIGTQNHIKKNKTKIRHPFRKTKQKNEESKTYPGQHSVQKPIKWKGETKTRKLRRRKKLNKEKDEWMTYTITHVERTQ